MALFNDLLLTPAPTEWWSADRGDGPIVGTAIHNGHHLRSALEAKMALAPDERLREEDPFTEYVIRDLPNRIVFHRSRFEIDINRARDAAIYHRPEQAWGLKVWRQSLPVTDADRSLTIHDAYYAMLKSYLEGIRSHFGRFVLLDIHSYNHRRDGHDKPAMASEKAPDINIGTFSMNRHRWQHVLDPFIDHLKGFSFQGRPLEVGENVAFQGKGEQTRFVHEHFPDTGCAIAIEFKKFFMDEWTGAPDVEALEIMREMIRTSRPLLEQSLRSAV
jgi:hypothetical protein